LRTLDFLEEVGSHGLTRGSVWKASSSCLVSCDVQTDKQSPTPIPVVKTKTNCNEGAKRAPRTSIKSHSMSLNGQGTPYFTHSNIPIYKSESILCWWITSWEVCPNLWTLMDDLEVVPEPLEGSSFQVKSSQ